MHRAAGVRDVDEVRVGGETGARRDVAPPERPAGLGVEGRDGPFVARRIDHAARHRRLGVDVGEPLELRAPARVRDEAFPDELAGRASHGGDAALVEAGDRDPGHDDGRAGAPHGERGHACVVGPAHLARRGVEPVQLPVEGARDDPVAREARPAQHLARELRAPGDLAGCLAQGDQLSVPGTGEDQPAARPDPAGDVGVGVGAPHGAAARRVPGGDPPAGVRDVDAAVRDRGGEDQPVAADPGTGVGGPRGLDRRERLERREVGDLVVAVAAEQGAASEEGRGRRPERGRADEPREGGARPAGRDHPGRGERMEARRCGPAARAVRRGAGVCHGTDARGACSGVRDR